MAMSDTARQAVLSRESGHYGEYPRRSLNYLPESRISTQDRIYKSPLINMNKYPTHVMKKLASYQQKLMLQSQEAFQKSTQKQNLFPEEVTKTATAEVDIYGSKDITNTKRTNKSAIEENYTEYSNTIHEESKEQLNQKDSILEGSSRNIAKT